MIKRSFWISGALFAVLLFLTWNLLERRHEPEAETFFTLERRTPDTLMVAYGTDTTVLVPGGAGWVLVRPVRYPADSFAVEALLKKLFPLEVENVYDLPPQKLDSYGLRNPRAAIRAAYVDLPPDSLSVGGLTPNAAYTYVRSGSERKAGLLSDRTARGYLLKSTPELRDSRLLPANENRVTRILLLADGRDHVELQKGEQGAWRVVKPYPGRADPGKTREYLASLVHMTVQEFIGEEGAGEAAYGLKTPRAGVVVETEAGETLGYSIGNAVPEKDLFYAAIHGRPNLFGVSARYLYALQWPDIAFRQTAPISFGLAQVSTVTVRSGSESREFRLSPPDSTLEPETLDVLGSWVLMRAEGFAEATARALHAYGLDAPAGELVWKQGADTLAVVQVAGDDNGMMPMRVAGGREARPEEILLVPTVKARPLWVYLAHRLSN